MGTTEGSGTRSARFISIMFEKENLFSEFTDTLKNNYGNYIGVSGYGEQYNITHMNQTMILVLFE